MFPNIEAERARENISQQDLADYLGVSLSTLKNWMNERTAIPSTALIKMSQRWGKSVDYLLGLSDIPQKAG